MQCLIFEMQDEQRDRNKEAADGRTANTNDNPIRSTVLPYGDTPTGGYRVPGLEATGNGTNRSAPSYGPNGAIRLNPVSGDALTAAGIGRQYLLIHGGDLSCGTPPAHERMHTSFR
jgi:hypothetical protein